MYTVMIVVKTLGRNISFFMETTVDEMFDDARAVAAQWDGVIVDIVEV
jgi:hypothetical protein